jgi:tectonin beta-propeller repeat-containing protein 1
VFAVSGTIKTNYFLIFFNFRGTYEWPEARLNMAPTLLFAINNEGKAYALSTVSSAWREFLYLGIEFKKLSAVPHFIWAIGGDRQVYLHVHSLDVPIRICEISFENERWYPGSGWSQSLLPTDRPRFSTEDGLIDRNIQNIRLPSMAWAWEGDWQLELTLDGQPLNHDAWTYAVDFPRQYNPKMSTFTLVRRRKWIRWRKYCALNSWCAISPLHKDPTEEPFIDCCVGGTSLDTSLMLVWAVTSHGRVMFRTGVSTTSPEGRKWLSIATDCEVSQISVGPTGMVWAACHNGRALVRSHVSRDLPIGKSWLEVPPPGNNLKLIQISVGVNSVWAITNDFHVWFRKGVNAATAPISEDATIGNGWIEMVGNMSSISVAGNDQVFAVGLEDRCIYMRSGVSLADPTGKKWKQIQCQMQMSRNSSLASMSRQSSTSSDSRHRSLTSLKNQQHERIIIQEDIEEQSRSAPTANNRQKVELWQKPKNDTSTIKEVSEVASSCPVSNDVYEVTGRQLKNPRAWSPIRSVGSVVAIEAHPESDSTVFEAEGTSRDSGVFGEDDFVGSQYWQECDIAWSNVASGAVSVDPNQLPNWFNDTVDDSQAEMNKPWRLNILENLKTRNEKESTGFEEYEKAVEASSWIKSGEVKVVKYNNSYEDCLIELEWVSSSSGMDCGTFTVLNSDGVSTKMQFLLNEITCVMTCSEPGHPRLAIYSPRLPATMSPLKLQFPGDTDLEDWLSHLSSVTSRLSNSEGAPSNDSIWITNSLGEVFVTDPKNLREQQLRKDNSLFFREIDVSATETPYTVKLPNGMPSGSFLKITGCVYDDADQIRFDLQSHATVKLRHKPEYFRNMPLHLNPRFNEKCIVLNSMELSNWENEERITKMVFAPGKEFELVLKSETRGFRIFVDGEEFVLFKRRNQSPSTIVSMHCSGRVKLFKIIYETVNVILPIQDVFWRQVGGHLRKVETCKAGVTWGIGYDHNLWCYTKGMIFI